MSRSLIKKENFIMLCLFLLCFFPGLCIIKYPQTVSAGVREGLHLCGEVMIPSMFPFLILSSFMLQSGIIDFFGRLLQPFFNKIFNVSGRGGGIFLISLLSGFPVGSNLISSALDRGIISQTEAKRLMMCCVNPGPAFVISAIGSSMLRSVRGGVIIFSSLTLSAVLMLFFSRLFFHRYEIENDKISFENTPLSSAFVSSVTNSSYSMLFICAFITLFSCICKVIGLLPLPEKAVEYLKMMLEVSIGSNIAAGQGNIPLVCAVVGWGGVCVSMQVFSAVLKSEMKKTLFFLSRAINCALSFFICKILLYFFPCPLEVFSSCSEVISNHFSSSVPAAIGLVLMSAILLTDIEELRKGQIFKKSEK